MERAALDKYVARYALPESVAKADQIDGTYERVVVVPACGESAQFISPLERAALVAGGRTLLLLVINARDDADAGVHAANEELLDAAKAHRHPALAVVVLDRASRGQRFGAKDGVGTARRLGLDAATALIQRGRVAEPWLFNTDGDTRVPAGYFGAVAGAGKQVSAVVLPFVHTSGGDAAIDRAHRLYEMSLRYYCLGLDAAGSTYAHHSMGSAMVFHAGAYAAARGMPRRQAAEDFYMLDKLAKLGQVWQPRCESIEISARTSNRVPFGTGRAVSTLLNGFAEGEEISLYDPRCFLVLGRVLRAVDDGSPEAIADLERDSDAAAALNALGAIEAMVDAARRARGDGNRRRRLREWFDGFRTMRFVHELRDRCYPNLPWREALRGAPFLHSGDDEGRGRDLNDLEVAFDTLCRLEWERLRN